MGIRGWIADAAERAAKDAAHMLDWDKPLSEQPESVRAAVQKLYDAEEMWGVGGPLDLSKDPTGSEIESAISRVQAAKVDPTAGNTLSGRAASTQKLREAGIPGITYKGATSDERNFVVFDDQLINITEKGAIHPQLLPYVAAGGAAAAALQWRLSETDTSAAEDALNASDASLEASAARFKQLRREKRGARLSEESARLLEPVAGPARQLLDATNAILVSAAGGIPGMLSELTGYIRGQDMEEARAGGQALSELISGKLADAMGLEVDPNNPYLQGLATGVEQAETEVRDAADRLNWEGSIPGKAYNALPERGQRIASGLIDLLL